jgi:hypothetical protein
MRGPVEAISLRQAVSASKQARVAFANDSKVSFGLRMQRERERSICKETTAAAAAATSCTYLRLQQLVVDGGFVLRAATKEVRKGKREREKEREAERAHCITRSKYVVVAQGIGRKKTTTL